MGLSDDVAHATVRCVVRQQGGGCGWEGHNDEARAAGRGTAAWLMQLEEGW